MTDKKNTLIPLSNGGHAIVDPCDHEFLSQWIWRKSDSGYAVRTVHIGGEPYKRSMHRIVADAPDGILIDHINRNRLDNRRSNLRFADHLTNAMNRSLSKYRKFRGVYPSGPNFSARIKHGGTLIHIGNFPTEEDAARAFDAECLRLRGSLAMLNFPDEQEAA